MHILSLILVHILSLILVHILSLILVATPAHYLHQLLTDLLTYVLSARSLPVLIDGTALEIKGAITSYNREVWRNIYDEDF